MIEHYPKRDKYLETTLITGARQEVNRRQLINKRVFSSRQPSR